MSLRMTTKQMRFSQSKMLGNRAWSDGVHNWCAQRRSALIASFGSIMEAQLPSVVCIGAWWSMQNSSPVVNVGSTRLISVFFLSFDVVAVQFFKRTYRLGLHPEKWLLLLSKNMCILGSKYPKKIRNIILRKLHCVRPLTIDILAFLRSVFEQDAEQQSVVWCCAAVHNSKENVTLLLDHASGVLLFSKWFNIFFRHFDLESVFFGYWK